MTKTHKLIKIFLLLGFLFFISPAFAQSEMSAEKEFEEGVRLFDWGTTSEEKRKAFELLTAAAGKRHIMATYFLGRAYGEGVGTAQDPVKALIYVTEAADAGSNIAQGKACEYYRIGFGTQKDIEKAIDYCTKSAEAGWPTGQTRLGFIYQTEKEDPQTAAVWYEKAAMQGDPGAQYLLGWLYWHKESMKDFEKGMKFMQMSANNNYDDALYEMGMYYLGSSPQNSIDPKQSFNYFKRATEQGHTEAPFWLAGMYVDAVGTERDMYEAYKWTLVALPKLKEPYQAVATQNEARMRTMLTPDQVNKAQEFASTWKPDASPGFASKWALPPEGEAPAQPQSGWRWFLQIALKVILAVL